MRHSASIVVVPVSIFDQIALFLEHQAPLVLDHNKHSGQCIANEALELPSAVQQVYLKAVPWQHHSHRVLAKEKINSLCVE